MKDRVEAVNKLYSQLRRPANRYLRLEDRELLTFSDFCADVAEFWELGDPMKDFGMVWRSSKDKNVHRSLTYAPGEPLEIGRDLNSWRDDGCEEIEIATLEEIAPYFDHLSILAPNKEVRDWMNYRLADAIRSRWNADKPPSR